MQRNAKRAKPREQSMSLKYAYPTKYWRNTSGNGNLTILGYIIAPMGHQGGKLTPKNGDCAQGSAG